MKAAGQSPPVQGGRCSWWSRLFAELPTPALGSRQDYEMSLKNKKDAGIWHRGTEIKLFCRRLKEESKRQQFGALSPSPKVAYLRKRSRTGTQMASRQPLLLEFCLLALQLSEGQRGFPMKGEISLWPCDSLNGEELSIFHLRPFVWTPKSLIVPRLKTFLLLNPNRATSFLKHKPVLFCCVMKNRFFRLWKGAF